MFKLVSILALCAALSGCAYLSPDGGKVAVAAENWGAVVNAPGGKFESVYIEGPANSADVFNASDFAIYTGTTFDNRPRIRIVYTKKEE